jgi:murein DD-endopeptidase MepM/ murein hydrolase activator NlpD
LFHPIFILTILTEANESRQCTLRERAACCRISRMVTRIRRYGLFALLLTGIMIVIGGLAFFTGWNSLRLRYAFAPLMAAPGAILNTSADLLPALLANVQYDQAESQGASALGIPPVGAYLPSGGSFTFEFPTPTATATATVTPTPSITPTPRPATLLAFVATITPATAPPRATPVPLREVYTYTGEECAPSGLPVGGGVLSQRYYLKHIGIDLVVPVGALVQATHSGIVEWAGWDVNGYGNLVVIHNGRYITYYAHLSLVSVRRGDLVGKHALIGLSGSTGNSSGPHIHYETRIDNQPVDPLTFEARALGTC